MTVLAAQDINLDAEPEEGRAGQMAAALDALTDSANRLRTAQKEVNDASRAAEEIKKKLEESRADHQAAGDESAIESLTRSLEEIEKRLESAHRKLVKADAKVKAAEQEAEALGVKATD